MHCILETDIVVVHLCQWQSDTTINTVPLHSVQDSQQQVHIQVKCRLVVVFPSLHTHL